MQIIIVILIALFFIITNLSQDTKSAIISDVKTGTIQTLQNLFDKSKGEQR